MQVPTIADAPYTVRPFLTTNQLDGLRRAESNHHTASGEDQCSANVKSFHPKVERWNILHLFSMAVFLQEGRNRALDRPQGA